MRIREGGDIVLSREEYETALSALSDGLSYDGGHHKQHYLAEAAKAIGMDLSDWDEDDLGIPA